MALLGISLALASLGYVFFVKQFRPWILLTNYFHPAVSQTLSNSSAATSRETNTEPRVDEDISTNGQSENRRNVVQDTASDEGQSRKSDAPSMKATAGTNAAPRSAAQMMPPPLPRPNRPSLGPSPNRGNLVPPSMPRGPLPDRGPPPGSRNAGSLLPPPTTSRLPTGMALPGKPTRKVILEPGHSPLDWAHLTRTRADLSGVENLQRITKSQLALQNGRKGRPAWSAFHGKVYNITPYLPFHPGGKGELMRAAGKDGGQLFMEVHPWVNWDNMLGSCLVGFLVSEADSTATSTMDQMD